MSKDQKPCQWCERCFVKGPGEPWLTFNRRTYCSKECGRASKKEYVKQQRAVYRREWNAIPIESLIGTEDVKRCAHCEGHFKRAFGCSRRTFSRKVYCRQYCEVRAWSALTGRCLAQSDWDKKKQKLEKKLGRPLEVSKRMRTSMLLLTYGNVEDREELQSALSVLGL